MLCLALLNGCSLNERYVRADRLTYKAIASEYREYVKHDLRLDHREVRNRLDTVMTWDIRITKAELGH